MKKNNLSILSLVTFGYYLVVGVSLSVFSIILKENNVGDFLIGLSDSIRRFSGIIFMFFIPPLVHRFGLYRMSMVSILAYTIPLLLMPFFVSYYLWLFYIVIFGAGMMSFMTFIDAVLNVVANNRNRPKINGYMNAIVLLAIALAPMVLKITGAASYFIFALCGIINIIGMFLYSKLKTEYREIKFVKNLDLIGFVRDIPYIFMSKIFLEFLGVTLFLFTVIYANSWGYSYENAGLLLSVYCLSGLVTSYSTGWAYGIIRNKKNLLIFSTIFTIALTILIPSAIRSTYLIFALYFLLGISTGFIHLGCLIIANETYRKEKIVSVNSALSIVGSLSMVFAGILSGFCMQHFDSMVMAVGILGGLYVILVLFGNRPTPHGNGSPNPFLRSKINNSKKTCK